MRHERVTNQVPSWVTRYMSDDEQGMLTAVAVNELVRAYLGLSQSFRLQSHLRCSVSGYGQVEVDELYIGQAADGSHVGIAVEAKDRSPQDCGVNIG